MRLDMSFRLIVGDFSVWESCVPEIDAICKKYSISYENRIYDEFNRRCDVTVTFPDETSLYNATNELSEIFKKKGIKEKCIKADNPSKKKIKKVVEEALAL